MPWALRVFYLVYKFIHPDADETDDDAGNE